MSKREHALADPVRAAAYFKALDETRQLTRAAQAVGVEPSSATRYRRRNPAFEAQVNETLGRPIDYDNRRRTFSLPKQRIFLEALAQSGCARTAAEAADVSWTAPYWLRTHDMGFAAAWASARDEAADRAYGRLLHQAIHGFEKTETLGGVEKHIVSHEAATVLRLLEHHAAERSRQPGTGRFVEITPERVAEARTTLLRRLTNGGTLTTMAEAIARAAAIPATVAA